MTLLARLNHQAAAARHGDGTAAKTAVGRSPAPSVGPALGNQQAAVLERHARPESPGSPPPGPAAPLSPETVTPLKPSEALRLGRLTRPRRITGMLFADDDGACALGSMLAAVSGGLEDVGSLDGGYSEIQRVLPTLGQRARPCPGRACDHVAADSILENVFLLNDAHQWCDDQIVAWLEGLGL